MRTTVIPWVMQLRRIWTLLLTLGTAVLGAADQFLPMFQGMIPPLVYVSLAIFLAVLPSLLDRRGKDRR